MTNLPELAPHDPITVSVGSAISAITLTRSDLSSSVTMTPGTYGVSISTGVQCGGVSLGPFQTGVSSICSNGGTGLTIGCGTGTSTDFLIINSTNTQYVMEVLHGQSYPNFPNSGIYTGTWGTGSDLRLKTDVQPIENGLASALSVETITYKWNEVSENPDKDTTFMGVSAQSVQKVFPTAVMEDHRGYLTVDYGRLSVLALAAIKELSARLDALESKQNS